MSTQRITPKHSGRRNKTSTVPHKKNTLLRSSVRRQVANRAKPPKDPDLSILQRSTLQWMAWRESGDAGEGQREEGTEAASRLESRLSGGMLGHLSFEEGSACVLALIQQEAANAPGGKRDRWAFTQRYTICRVSLHVPIAKRVEVSVVLLRLRGDEGSLVFGQTARWGVTVVGSAVYIC